MKLLVFHVDGRIIKCHHVIFINITSTVLVAILSTDDHKQIETIDAIDILSIQYEDKDNGNQRIP